MNEQAPPEAVIVGGPNGAGKTTFAMEFLQSRPGYCYIGADAIAKRLSPDRPELAAISAGRQFLEEVEAAIEQRENVVIETTLAGRSFRHTLAAARDAGYLITLVFTFVDSAEICVGRVEERVRKGGHLVPENDVRRRFTRSIHNFWSFYRSMADQWFLLYNSKEALIDVAFGEENAHDVLDELLFDRFERLLEK